MAASKHDSSRYKTYFNYVLSLRRLMRGLYPQDEALRTAIEGGPAYAKLPQAGAVDRAVIARGLRHVWFTELALCAPGRVGDELRYQTPWSMVQVYYAVYHAARLYFVATGRSVGQHHASTLKTLGADLIACRGRFPAPWAATVGGDPDGALSYSGFPASFALSLRSPLANPATIDPWQYLALALKTTRRRSIDQAALEWPRRHPGRKLDKAGRAQLAIDQRPTHLFDLFYRFRARSNYKDSDAEIYGAATADSAAALHDALCEVTHLTLLMFETQIAGILGRKWLQAEVAALAREPVWRPAQQTVLRRWGG